MYRVSVTQQWLRRVEYLVAAASAEEAEAQVRRQPTGQEEILFPEIICAFEQDPSEEIDSICEEVCRCEVCGVALTGDHLSRTGEYAGQTYFLCETCPDSLGAEEAYEN